MHEILSYKIKKMNEKWINLQKNLEIPSINSEIEEITLKAFLISEMWLFLLYDVVS